MGPNEKKLVRMLVILSLLLIIAWHTALFKPPIIDKIVGIVGIFLGLFAGGLFIVYSIRPIESQQRAHPDAGIAPDIAVIDFEQLIAGYARQRALLELDQKSFSHPLYYERLNRQDGIR